MKPSPSLLATVIAFIVCFSQVMADDKPAAKSYEGTLETGVMSIGGETTGTVLHTKSDGDYELDLGGKKELLDAADKLNGKKVVVTGDYKPKPGVEVKERRIIEVQTLKAGE